MFKHVTLPLVLLASPAFASSQHPPEPADALTVQPHFEDAERFIALFEEMGGKPTAQQLEARYLVPGSYGITVATPNRIVDADNLARAVAADPQAYRKAIDECLPIARGSEADLRSIYLGLKGALPDLQLPQVYFYFGAGNSGGTAEAAAQALGLEVLCAEAKGPDDLTRILRHFYAHELVHSLQQQTGAGAADTDYLLRQVLIEGAADFIARLVTGTEPSAERAAWGRAQGTPCSPCSLPILTRSAWRAGGRNGARRRVMRCIDGWPIMATRPRAGPAKRAIGSE